MGEHFTEDLFDMMIDSLLDSLKVLAIVLVIYIILSFVESKLSRFLEKNEKMSPLLGSALGIIPQCGFSVVAADLYLKRHITMGTLIGIFIATSDEALPMMFSNPKKIIYIIPLILIKFILGFVVGFLVDVIYRKSKENVTSHHDECHHEEEIHIGCCGHEIDNLEESKVHKHLIHPIVHSLKIFGFVLIVNLVFGLLILLVGEDNLVAFLNSSKYVAPLFSVIIGIIPNCASSVVITDLYLVDGLSFGAALGGLIMNAGLGMVILFKNKANFKNNMIIFAILFGVSLVAAYATCFIIGF